MPIRSGDHIVGAAGIYYWNTLTDKLTLAQMPEVRISAIGNLPGLKAQPQASAPLGNDDRQIQSDASGNLPESALVTSITLSQQIRRSLADRNFWLALTLLLILVALWRRYIRTSNQAQQDARQLLSGQKPSDAHSTQHVRPLKKALSNALDSAQPERIKTTLTDYLSAKWNVPGHEAISRFCAMSGDANSFTNQLLKQIYGTQADQRNDLPDSTIDLARRAIQVVDDDAERQGAVSLPDLYPKYH